MALKNVVRDIEPLLRTQGRLIRLHRSARVAFIGDIHGDLDAVDRVFSLLGSPDTVLVFLGDIVDRGPASSECLERILRAKAERPDHVFLLMGNHEAWGEATFRPADFWGSLSDAETALIAPTLLQLPYAAQHESGILALHGALPDVCSLDEIDRIPLGSTAWRDITWGDWTDRRAERESGSGRPCYGLDEFSTRVARLGIRVLVRSHQPDAPRYLFGDRCLTLFTSHAYGAQRQAAVLPKGRGVRTARDMELIEI